MVISSAGLGVEAMVANVGVPAMTAIKELAL
jgi:hypothetical protein